MSCSRKWQAEAVHDGRLSGADRGAFERHAAGCAECAREVRALRVLDERARALPALESEPLARLRRRHALLQLANERTVQAAPRRAVWRWMALVASLALAGWALWFNLHRARPRESTLAAPVVPTYRLIAGPDSEWRIAERSTTLRLRTLRGRFELAVDKLRDGQRFLLELPDGELEVQGTRFVVEVDAGRSRSVQVNEGRVALRLLGYREIILRGGERWNAPPETATSAGSSVSGSPRADPPDAAAPRAFTPPSAGNGPTPQTSATPLSRAGSDFTVAMAAFSAGDYGRAEQLLLAFERAHPSDARVEDALFLRAVARARRGDVAAAERLARSYLERYPHGLRRQEAERLSER